LVHLPLYRPFLLGLRVALCVLLAALLVLGDVTAALIVAVFLALSFAHLLRSDRRPAVFDVLFALAAGGAIGYAFGLFDEIVPYDELTHAFTTFSVSLAFYFLFYGGAVPEQRAVALATSVFTLGVTVGAYWEIFEWFFVGKFTMADTISDLLVDSVVPWRRRSWRWRSADRGIALRSFHRVRLLRAPFYAIG
jgi:VanZ family protein